MNFLTGTVINISTSGSILLADVEVEGCMFTAMLIESVYEKNWLKKGNTIGITFKETEVSLAKNLSGKISMRNKINCIITNITKGELLSKVGLQYKNSNFTSVITTRSVIDLELQIGDEILALIKTNEVSLTKID